MIGIFITRLRPTDRNGMKAINRSFFISAAHLRGGLRGRRLHLPAGARFAELTGADRTSPTTPATGDPRLLALAAVVIGIAARRASRASPATSPRPQAPGARHRRTSLTGPATVILSGISVGLESAVYSALLIAAAVYGAFLLGGGVILFAVRVALAGTGLLTTVGVIVAMDTFGPVSDNAQGIAEMSGDVHGEGAAMLTSLDAVGNTTKAITKGIAIATAVLAATALFGSFTDAVKTRASTTPASTLGDDVRNLQYTGVLNVADPSNLVGLLIGAAVVFLFSGLAINAVSRAAGAVVFEVRQQFRKHPGSWTAPRSRSTAASSTSAPATRCASWPRRVCSPCWRRSPSASPSVSARSAAYLAGAIATGTLMAVFLANSGGAWDNAKKLIEDGNYGGKGSAGARGHDHRRHRR